MTTSPFQQIISAIGLAVVALTLGGIAGVPLGILAGALASVMP